MNLPDSKGYSPAAQVGLLIGMMGAGMVVTSFVTGAVWLLFGSGGLANMSAALYQPANANLIRTIQLISTLLMFFVPAAAFAFISYKNGWRALGFKKSIVPSLVFASIVIILAAGPLIDALSELNKAIPLSAGMRSYFDGLEQDYEKQIKIIGAVNSFPQYLLSLVMIALLPALFEEVLFRGALQGILTRWFKHAWVAILVTGLVFSAIHFSWYGFIPRIVLGVLLGLIFYYTKNIWYSIIVHFFNNGLVVTYMYYSSINGKAVSVQSESMFPWWAGVGSVAVLYILFKWLKKAGVANNPQIDNSQPQH